jgi:hypothetical protein
MANAFPPLELISFAVSWIVPGRMGEVDSVRAAMTTVAPSLAKERAMAFPIPLLAPVTMATLSFN